tara:strand:+ start:710 stop:1369 length:660 start_codon:yes stop_codon:yes gene_type:complete
MKFKVPKMDKLLNDKNVLYVVFVLAILNILGYLLVRNTEAVAFFIIVGFLSTYFSKNMIVVLSIAMVSTSLFNSTRTRPVQEGMSSQRDEAKDTLKSKMQEKKQEKKQEVNSNDYTPENKKSDVSTSASAKKNNRIDYAGTLEEAYTKLSKTVGEGGIEGLTSQTETLLEQQKNLMDNIKGMQPFLNTAESFMNNLDLSGLEGIGGMLSKLGKTEDKKQ